MPNAVFNSALPESFEILTSDTKQRLYGFLYGMDKYALFIGSAIAQNELAKIKGNFGMPTLTKQDLKEMGEALIELSEML